MWNRSSMQIYSEPKSYHLFLKNRVCCQCRTVLLFSLSFGSLVQIIVIETFSNEVHQICFYCTPGEWHPRRCSTKCCSIWNSHKSRILCHAFLRKFHRLCLPHSVSVCACVHISSFSFNFHLQSIVSGSLVGRLLVWLRRRKSNATPHATLTMSHFTELHDMHVQQHVQHVACGMQYMQLVAWGMWQHVAKKY